MDRRAARSRWAARSGARLVAVAWAVALAAVGACASEEDPTPTVQTGSSSSSGAMLCEPGSKQPCYTGKPGTKNVGTCKEGERTCAPDGASFGICEGQINPVVDDCSTPEDEDCDGTPAPQCAGTVIFSRAAGGTDNDQGRAVAFDASGAAIVTGYLGGGASGGKGADFGGGQVTVAGGHDLFMAKYDAAGGLAWANVFGDDANQEGSAIAVSAAGDIFVTGFFGGKLDFGGGVALTSLDAKDGFIAKLSPQGSVVWAKAFGDATGPQQGTGLAVDAKGDVVLVGSFEGVLNFGGAPLICQGGSDIFAVKLDGVTGAHVWSKSVGDLTDQSPRGVAVDAADGSATITGGFKGTIDFGLGPLTSAGGEDIFVAKFDAQGGAVFAKAYGAAMDEAGQSVAVDSKGVALVGGSFKGAIDMGGGALTSAGAEDIFLMKLDAAGAHQWSKRFGDGSSQILQSVAVDADGVIVIAGKFMGALDFGQKPLIPSSEAYDIFAAKLDADGAFIWGHGYGSTFDQVALGAAISATGEAAITGTYFGSVDFKGGDPKASTGLSDLFYVRFSP